MTKKRLRTSSPVLNVRVPQEIIETSTERDSSHCMIAEAVQRAVPKARFISVDLATIRFSDPEAGVRYIYLTPRTAQAALLAFDQGEKPGPFNVRLEGAHVVPSGTARKGKASLEPDSRHARNVPVRAGGQAPPMGPLRGGNDMDRRSENRIGKRREFGLRAIIR